jgi:hypothetical protein
MPVVRGCTIKIFNSDPLSAHIGPMKNLIALISLIGMISLLVVDLLVCCEA